MTIRALYTILFIGDNMNITNKLLYMLENCDISLSGEQIARELYVSRNAVWKAVNSLRQEGFIIDAVTNKGYSISKNNTRFSKYGIEKHLKHNCDINIFETLPSTNIIAKELATNGANEGTIIIAREQTNGKGRLGRYFSSQYGGLYMSIILRPDTTASATTLITAAAAVAVCRAVDKVCDVNTGIKWVNDIFLNGKKICGILTQGSVSLENNCVDYAVLGIGLNINRPKGDFPEELRNIAASIFDIPCNSDTQNRLIAEILNEFFNIYKSLPNAEFMDEYRTRSIIIGTEVLCVDAQNEYPVTVDNIDDNAHLLVTTKDNKKLTLNSGEVRIKI